MHDVIGLLNLLIISKINFKKIYVPSRLYDANADLFASYADTFHRYGGNDVLGIVLVLEANVEIAMEKTIRLLTFMGWDAKKQVESMGVVICS